MLQRQCLPLSYHLHLHPWRPLLLPLHSNLRSKYSNVQQTTRIPNLLRLLCHRNHWKIERHGMKLPGRESLARRRTQHPRKIILSFVILEVRMTWHWVQIPPQRDLIDVKANNGSQLYSLYCAILISASRKKFQSILFDSIKLQLFLL
jgi:hypothetical protein